MFADWEEWELIQRRDALTSLIKAYADIPDKTTRQQIKLRRYQREHAFVDSELQCRDVPLDKPIQLVIIFE